MGHYWVGLDGVIETFKALGYLVKRCSPHKLGAVFATSERSLENKHRTPILKTLKDSNFTQQCNMSYCLSKILDIPKFKKRLVDKKTTGLNLYIFTAGLWLEVPGSSKFCGVDDTIMELFNEMSKNNVDSSTISIRFIRFGNDPVGSKRLDQLIDRFRSKDIPTDFW